MKLLVQEYLESKTFGDLAREHGVYASFSKSGRKWSLNYDQIEAKESDPLSQECRGLVLSCEDGAEVPGIRSAEGKINRDDMSPGPTRILAFPMKRFFNHGQGSAAEINWHDPNLAVLEKLDGTLCIMYFDPFTNQWCVATRSVPEADLLMDNGLFTFRTLFEKALEETCKMDFNGLTKLLDERHTYCFELTTPYNRIVVQYPNNGITLLAARDLITHLEVYPDQCIMVRDGVVPCVQTHTYAGMDELVSWVSTLSPKDHEGVVVRDSQFNRIKIKNAQYVALNKCRDTLSSSPRNCLELIWGGNEDDVIPFLPEEIVNNLLSIKGKYRKWLEEQERLYTQVMSEASAIMPSDKKTFAITLNKYGTPFRPAFFAIFDGKAESIKNFIAKNKKDGTWSNGFLDRILGEVI